MSQLNLLELFESPEIDDIIDRLNAYAISRLKLVDIKSFNGKEPSDFVGDLILKVIEGQRDWSKAQCTFKEFLFGCLKSDINSFFKSQKYIVDEEIIDVKSDEQQQNIEEERKLISNFLKQDDADDDELLIFEIWVEGITKPSEIAKEFGIDVKEVYNITKRIERRLSKIRNKAKNIL